MAADRSDPFWSGIFPDELLANETLAEQAFRPLAWITAKCAKLPLARH